MNKTIQNVRATDTGPALAAHLKANGWDGVVYMGEVITKRTKREAMMYRNAANGEFVVVASVKA